jgi:DNA repair exonuclease SbcCD ATPase subunit
MNKQELEEEIKSIKAVIQTNENAIERLNNRNTGYAVKLQDLQAELEQCGNRWRARKGGEYYCVGGSGDIEKFMESSDDFDEWHYKIGNYFATQVEAEEYKKALLMVQEYECEIERKQPEYVNYITIRYKIGKNVADGCKTGCNYAKQWKQQAEELEKDLKLVLRTKGV